MTNEELCTVIQKYNWEFTEANTQYLTHNIHRYSGKFIPQIAGKAIDLLTEPNDLILDSYMGSGTTLLEAMLRGRNSVGVDLNPLAVLISRVKTTIVSSDDIDEIYSELLPFVNYLASGGQLSLMSQPFNEDKINEQIEKNNWRIVDEWHCKWYQTDVLKQLVQIYSCIEIIENEKAKNIALVAFSDILRKSSNASSKYPNVMYDKNAKKKPLPAKPFLESLNNVVEAVKALSYKMGNKSCRAGIIMQNNLALSIDSESVDAIISHPPYIAAVPYAEYGSLSLTWLGFDCKALDGELTGGRRHSTQVVSRFSDDYKQYFFESFRVLKPNKYMFLMVGNPTAHGARIDLNEMTETYAKDAGFLHIATAIRHGQNRRGNKMGDEYLMFFQKVCK